MTPEWYQKRLISAEAAIGRIRPGERVFLATGAAVPQALVRVLADGGNLAPDIETVQLLTLGPADYLARPSARSSVFFVSANSRVAVNELDTEYAPAHLSELPGLIRSGAQRIDVALLSVTPPDANGLVSMGPSVDVALAAVERARLVIAQINRRLPRTRGASLLPADRIHWFVEHDEPVPELPQRTDPGIVREAERIGGYLAEIVPDGAVLQCGIGSWINHSLGSLKSRRNFRIHTELFSDGLQSLIEHGAAEPAGAVASFAMGRRSLYEFLETERAPEFLPADQICSPFEIARKPRMTSINAALEIDLTGQVSADSLGGFFYSGPGGFSDFQRGAAMAKSGTPVVVLRSTAIGGRQSRIVPVLSPGAGVAASRADIHWVITEWGAANLFGKSVRDRALILSELAHPDFRCELLNRAKERRLIHLDDRLRYGSERRYPAEYETQAVLRDGRKVRIRPIRKSDEDRLRALFYSESETSIYRRFHGAVRALPRDRIRLFFDIDYHSRMGLGVYEEENGDEVLIGLGSYALNPSDRYAEVAFLVRDDRQGFGVGTLLLDRLIAITRNQGFAGLLAFVLTENSSMMSLFRKSGLPLDVRVDAGIYEVRMKLEQT